MIRKINGFYYSLIPFNMGLDSASTTSTGVTYLSGVFVDQGVMEQGTTVRVKTLFRKGVVNNTTYNVQIYWNTGTTINSTSVKLVEVSVSGSTSAVGIERHISTKTVLSPILSYATLLTGSTETDIGDVGTLYTNFPEFAYSNSGYFMATASRTNNTRTLDSILCSYIYVDIY